MMGLGAGDVLRAQFDGAVRELLFMAGQTTTTLKVSQEDEALRFCRVLRARTTSSIQHPGDVANRLEAIATLWDARESAGIDARTLDAVHLGAEGTTERSYLEGLAGLLRTADEVLPPDYVSVPMSGWEGHAMYPVLFQFSYNFESGDYPESSDAIQDRIDRECSAYCRWDLPPLIGEVNDALARFPEEDVLHTNFASSMAWASTDILREIDRLTAAHLSTHHQKTGW